MPEEACRLFLKIKSSRVERLQDISEKDAIDEGVEKFGNQYNLAYKDYENQPFSFTIPQESFIDIDSDILNYTASLEDGSDLPSWLSFDAATQTFSGTPTFDDAGVLRVKVMASDGQFTTSQVFSLDVVDVNRAPVQVDNSTLVMDEDSGSLSIDVLSQVQDLDGDVPTISNVSVDANQGSVILNVDNTISFTPTANFNGTAQVSYQVDDEEVAY